MSKSLKELVKGKVKRTREEEAKEKRKLEQLENENALQYLAKYMQTRLELLMYIDNLGNFNSKGFHKNHDNYPDVWSRLGLKYDSFLECWKIPPYKGGKYTPAQLLARKYNAELKKARKEREQEIKSICKELAEKLKSGEFTIESVGLYHDAIAVKVDGNPGKYEYDGTVVNQFLKRRGLRLNNIKEGRIYIEIPD